MSLLFFGSCDRIFCLLLDLYLVLVGMMGTIEYFATMHDGKRSISPLVL